MERDVSEERSHIMRSVRSKNTTPELAVRRLIHSLGYRYRLHDRKLPGRPDIVFPGMKKVVFVNGCFWHAHEGCKKFSIPKTRSDWWRQKLFRNSERDRKNIESLKKLGWDSEVVWECQIHNPKKIQSKLKDFLGRRKEFCLPSLRAKEVSGQRKRFLLDEIEISAPLGDKGLPMAKAKKSKSRARSSTMTSRSKKVSKKKAATKRPTQSSKVRRVPRKTTQPESLSLPSKYSSHTDASAGTMKISEGKRDVSIHMKSFASVASALALMEMSTPSMITVSFGERPGFAIPAEAFPDVANALSVFGSSDRIAPPRPIKVASPKPPVQEPPQVTAPKKAKAESQKRKSPKKTRPSENTMPEWFKNGFKDKYEAERDGFSLKRTRLSIDPEKPKIVLGSWKKGDEISAWGYEVLSGTKHVAWILADEPQRFLITEEDGIPPSSHRAIVGVMARIASMIMPEFRNRK